MKTTYRIVEKWDGVSTSCTIKLDYIKFTYYRTASDAFAYSTNTTPKGSSAFSLSANGKSILSLSTSADGDGAWTIPFGGSTEAVLNINGSAYESNEFTVTRGSSGNITVTVGGCWSWGTAASYPLDTAYGISDGAAVQKTASATLTNSAPSISVITVATDSVELGGQISYSINHKKASYRYEVGYICGDLTGNVITGQTSKTGTFNTSVLNINSTSICSLVCTTFNGSTRLGVSTAQFYVTVTTSPIISDIAVTHSSSSTVVNTWHAESVVVDPDNPLYVQSYSKAIITFSVTWPINSERSATYINDGTGNVNATTVAGQTNRYQATTNIFNSAGARSISIVAVDSRGRSAVSTKNIFVTPYVAPYVLSANALRYSTNVKVEDRLGTNISAKVNASGNWSVGGRNDLTIYVRYKQTGESHEYPQVSMTLDNNADYVQINLSGGTVAPILTSRSYVVQFLLCDDLHTLNTNPVTVERTVVTSAFVIHSKDGGGGIALGGYNEADEAEIFYTTHLHDNLRLDSKSYGTGYPTAAGAQEGQVYFKLIESTGGESGFTTDDYLQLNNLPAINGQTIIGDLSTDDLGVENVDNKVTSLSSESTDEEYPSAKAVYDAMHESGVGNVYVVSTDDDFDTVASTIYTVKNEKAVLLIDDEAGESYSLLSCTRVNSVYSISFIRLEEKKMYIYSRSTGDDEWSRRTVSLADPANANISIFTANSSTYAEVQNEFIAGKILFVRFNNDLYSYAWRYINGTAIEFGFARVRRDKVIDIITIDNSDNWGQNSIDYLSEVDDMLSEYQPISERTTLVNALSTDNQYPTARAVYAAILASGGGGGGGGGSDDIFIAIPGATTYDQVTNALGDGKLVFANVSGRIFPYVGSNEIGYRFAQIFRTDCYAYILSYPNVWTDDSWTMGEGGSGSDSHVFFATYLTTTYDEIDDAIDDGKYVFAVKDSRIYPYAGVSSGLHRFYGIVDSTTVYLTINTNDTWGTNVSYMLLPTAIAENFVQTKAWSIGDYTTHNGELYRCKRATSSGVAWSLTNWEKTSVMAEIGNVEAALAALR